MCSSRDLQLLITVTVLDCHRDSDRCLRVIGCDKREAFAQGSEATKQFILPSLRYGCVRIRPFGRWQFTRIPGFGGLRHRSQSAAAGERGKRLEQLTPIRAFNFFGRAPLTVPGFGFVS